MLLTEREKEKKSKQSKAIQTIRFGCVIPWNPLHITIESVYKYNINTDERFVGCCHRIQQYGAVGAVQTKYPYLVSRQCTTKTDYHSFHPYNSMLKLFKSPKTYSICTDWAIDHQLLYANVPDHFPISDQSYRCLSDIMHYNLQHPFLILIQRYYHYPLDDCVYLNKFYHFHL